MRYLFYFLSLFIFVLLGALSGAPNTTAQSEYDNVIQTTDELRQTFSTSNPSQCQYIRGFDFKYRWPEFFQPTTFNDGFNIDGTSIPVSYDQQGLNFQNYQSTWINRKHWAVTQLVQNNGQDKTFAIIWTTDEISSLEFRTETPLNPRLWTQNSNNNYYALVTINSYQGSVCSLTVTGVGLQQSFSVAYNLSIQQYPLFINWPITYPPNYQGQYPPDTVAPPTIPIDYWVNYSYTNTTSILRAQYLNKRTDPTSNLPDPVSIYWRLLVDAPIVTEGGSLVCEANRPVKIPFDSFEACPEFTPDPTKEYFLYAQINPLRNPELNNRDDYEITFKVNTYKIDFSKPSTGSTENCEPGAILDFMNKFCVAPETIDFTQCFTDGFPFVDPFECADNFSLIFQFLAFGGIRFPEWSHDPQCKSLNTMDDWLNLPNGYTACPLFPSTVRTIVTPFIAFLLGIVTLGFIQRHNQSGGY